MSQKPTPVPAENQQKRKRKRKSKDTITRAVTHIRLLEANPGKLAELDTLMAVYLPLCQQYVSLWCRTALLPGENGPVLPQDKGWRETVRGCFARLMTVTPSRFGKRERFAVHLPVQLK